MVKQTRQRHLDELGSSLLREECLSYSSVTWYQTKLNSVQINLSLASFDLVCSSHAHFFIYRMHYSRSGPYSTDRLQKINMLWLFQSSRKVGLASTDRLVVEKPEQRDKTNVDHVLEETAAYLTRVMPTLQPSPSIVERCMITVSSYYPVNLILVES